MKTWKIPVCWSMMGTVCVEADTLEEAVEIAKDDEGVIPIPDNGSFLDGSWEVDCVDIDYLRQYYNGNQTDNMNKIIDTEDVIGVIKNFLSCNEGDEATECLVLSIGAEILGVSVDTLFEMIKG